MKQDKESAAIVASSLSLFQDCVKTKIAQEKKEDALRRDVIKKKKRVLAPLAALLSSIQAQGVRVENADKASPTAMPELFEFEEAPSSPSWEPGVSFLITHPASIEIAVPNKKDISVQGVVVLHLSHHNPYAYMLEGPFMSVQSACEALAKFIAAQTLEVENPV